MARKVEADIRRLRKRLYGEADEVSTTTVQAWIEQFTRAVLGSRATKHIKFRQTSIILQSLSRERFNGERKVTQRWQET